MDADQLRLVLLALGGVLVILIYGWDRYKRSRNRLRPMPRRVRRRQPVLGDRPDMQEPEGELPRVKVEEGSDPLAPVELSEENAVSPSLEPDLQSELEFSALEESDYIHLNPDLQEDLPRLVIQVALVRRETPYKGEEIQQAMAEVNMVKGEMDIFHRYDKQRTDQVLFSIASMVEPGYFPEAMEDFTTPGLLLFTQLPGIRDGMLVYSEMLFTAERLAGLLGGVLQDDTHSVLSKQTMEHTRESILEHRRKVQLARKR